MVRKHLSSAFLTLSILLTNAIPSHSQVVDFTATAGFEGRARPGQYAPLTMTLRADESLSGTIRIMTNRDEICRIPFSLRDGETLRILKNLHLTQYGLMIECYDQEDSLLARLSQHQIVTQQFYRNEIHILDVSRNPFQVPGLATFPFRGGQTGQNRNSNRPDVVTSHVDASAFPRHSRMLESVDAIIVGDAVLEEFAVPSRAALLNWVYRGGLLILRGGGNADSLERSFLAPYLPLRKLKVGISDQHVPRISSVDSRPYPVIVNDYDPLSELSARGMDNHHESDRLWRETVFGAGRIRLLYFDPSDEPFRSNSVTAEYVFKKEDATIFDLNNTSNTQNDFRRFPMDLVTQIADLPGPPITLITFFLLFYIILVGPVNFWFLSRLGRRELAWGSIPAVVLVFSAAALGVGYGSMGGTTTYREFSVILADMNEGTEEVETLGGIFSAVSQSFELAFSPEVVSANEVMEPSQGSDNPILFLGPRPDRTDKFIVNQWSWKFVRTLSVSRPDYTVTFDSAARKITVEGNLDLANSYLRFNQKFHLLEKDGDHTYKVSFAKPSLGEPEFSQLDLA
ncbi:MAG: hypothetical protein AAB229_00535, partial [Candidatus Hydrogenedentota bacterium]